MILPPGSGVGVNFVRQFDDFVIHRGIALGIFRGLFLRRARRHGAVRFGKAFASGHRKPGDAAHQLGFARLSASPRKNIYQHLVWKSRKKVRK
jgi:hypothetical protein